jgi:Protein of unknown function (DUF3769)
MAYPISIPPIAPPALTAPAIGTPLPPDQRENLPAPIVPPKPIVPSQSIVPPAALQTEGIVELLADTQTFDRDRGIFTADGNVRMRFRNSLLVADRVEVNLINRFAVGEGKVTLTRGAQVLQGDRFEYNFVQGEGKIRGARGELYVPTLSEEPRTLPSDISPLANLNQPIGERIYANQPAQNVQSAGGIEIGSGSGTTSNPTARAAGTVRRLRYEADSADFTPAGTVAENVRITNDPYSPPELELRAKTLRFKPIGPLQDEIRIEKPQLILDQRFKVPLLVNRFVIDRRRRPPALFRLGYDVPERGGVFIQRTIDIFTDRNFQFSVTPQILVQRGFTKGFGLDSFGLTAKLNGTIGDRTRLSGVADLNSLNLSKAGDQFRGNFKAEQLVGTHTLSLGGSFRDRLFNNSLGFQNVQSSVGLLLTSPNIVLGKTGINLSYQVGYQRITANTDRFDLLAPIRKNDRLSSNRFQSSVALSRGFSLWQGKPLAATPTAGLRYTPTPLVPYVGLGVGVTGVASFYSRGNTQRSVGGNISLNGQFGHSSKDYLDYTAFNLTYSQVALGDISPFLFDRVADTQVLSGGITQQVYGPWRVGFQTAWNLDTRVEISTDYLIEYSRRTHGVLLRYNPIQGLGSINLRISDFNWTGGAETFGGSGVRSVSNGVTGSGSNE